MRPRGAQRRWVRGHARAHQSAGGARERGARAVRVTHARHAGAPRRSDVRRDLRRRRSRTLSYARRVHVCGADRDRACACRCEDCQRGRGPPFREITDHGAVDGIVRNVTTAKKYNAHFQPECRVCRQTQYPSRRLVSTYTTTRSGPGGAPSRESEAVPEGVPPAPDSPSARLLRVPRSVNGVRLSVETVRALTLAGPLV